MPGIRISQLAEALTSDVTNKSTIYLVASRNSVKVSLQLTLSQLGDYVVTNHVSAMTFPDKATNDIVDAETDDTNYMTAAKTYRAIGRKVKTATTTVAGIGMLARVTDVDSNETDTGRLLTVATGKTLIGRLAPPGQFVPAGGTKGQILEKKSATDYDTQWINKPEATVALSKATNDDVDTETDDAKYVTVAKVFRAIARKVKTATNTVAGIVTLARNEDVDATETDTTRIPTVALVKRLIARLYLPLTGGTLTGDLTLKGAPTDDLHAATKKYVDAIKTGTTVLSGTRAPTGSDGVDKDLWLEGSGNGNVIAVWENVEGNWVELVRVADSTDEVRALQHLSRDLHALIVSPEWTDASDSDGDLYHRAETDTTDLADTDFDNNGASATSTDQGNGTTNIYVRLPAASDHTDFRMEVDSYVYWLGNSWTKVTGPDETTYQYWFAGDVVRDGGSTFQLQKHPGSLAKSRFDGALGGEAKKYVDDRVPVFPAEGSRDGKVPKFDGDTLKWLADAEGSGGTNLTKASNTDVDTETDDSDYMTVLKTFRAIARKVKNASTTARGIVLLARATDVNVNETDTTRVPTIANVKTLITRLFLPLTGGTLTGKLTLDGDPTDDKHAATKKYVDDNAGTGGTGEDNVQSDWDQTDDTADDYVKNKPDTVIEKAVPGPSTLMKVGETLTITDVGETIGPMASTLNDYFVLHLTYDRSPDSDLQMWTSMKKSLFSDSSSYDIQLQGAGSAHLDVTLNADGTIRFDPTGRGAVASIEAEFFNVIGAKGEQGAFYLELRLSASSTPSKPTALTYDYDSDSFSVTPNTWKLKDDFTPAAGERVYEVRAAIDPRNDAGKGSIDILSRLGNPIPITGEKGAAGTGEENVQVDWDQTDSSADDFIKGKPKIKVFGNFDDFPAVDAYNIGDILSVSDQLYELGITDENTANLYEATVGRSSIHLGDEHWRGVANSQSPNGFSTDGGWSANPNNAIALIMASDARHIRVAIKKSVFDAAKGSAFVSTDHLYMSLALESGNSDVVTMAYYNTYTRDDTYIVFQHKHASRNYHLYGETAGNSIGATFRITSSTGNLIAHAVSAKHWLLYGSGDGDTALQLAQANQARLDALDVHVDGATPNQTFTFDKDNVTFSHTAFTQTISNVKNDDLIALSWENFHPFRNVIEHVLPGSSDAEGRMYFRVSDLGSAYIQGQLGKVTGINRLASDSSNDTLNSRLELDMRHSGTSITLELAIDVFGNANNVNLLPPANMVLNIDIYRNTTADNALNSVHAQLESLKDMVETLDDRLVVLTETEYTNLAVKDPKKFYFTYDDSA